MSRYKTFMKNMNDNVLVQNCKISVSMLNSIFRSCSSKKVVLNWNIAMGMLVLEKNFLVLLVLFPVRGMLVFITRRSILMLLPK